MKKTTKISLEDAEQRLFEKHGNNITMKNYVKMGDFADFYCNVCGNSWRVPAVSVITTGDGCKECGYKSRNEKRTIPVSKIQSLIKANNPTVKIITCNSLSSKGKFECLICNKQWEVEKSRDVVYGKRHCPYCARKNRTILNTTPFEKILEYIKNKNCEYISGEYINNRSILKIKFSCGHIDNIRVSNFINVSNCRKCSKIETGNKLKKEEKVIITDLKKSKLIFIEFIDDYKNGKSRIRYRCEKGHICISQINTFYKNKACTECLKMRQYDNRKGHKHPNWNGGTSAISPLIKGNMIEWKKESIKNSKYKCVITGDRFQAVHHLYGFNMILDEALFNLNIKNKTYVKEYSELELESIINECKKLHKNYPLGVCLRKDIHILFHKIYGHKNNTPDQFYDFIDRINSGEIQIPE